MQSAERLLPSDAVEAAAAQRPSGAAAYAGAGVVVFNLIVGSGVLAVPKAFYEAGWALGIIVLCVMGFFAYCSIVWLFECQLRAQALNAAFVAGCIRVVPFGKSTGMDELLHDSETPTTTDDDEGHEEPAADAPRGADGSSDGGAKGSAEDLQKGTVRSRSISPLNDPGTSAPFGPFTRKHTMPPQWRVAASAQHGDNRTVPGNSVGATPNDCGGSHPGAAVGGSLDDVGKQLGYGICVLPAHTPMEAAVAPRTPRHDGLSAPPSPAVPVGAGMPIGEPFNLYAASPPEFERERATSVASTARSQRSRSRANTAAAGGGGGGVVINASMSTDCPAVVFDPSHADDALTEAPQTTMPFVLAVKAQQAHNWYGLYDVEPAVSVEDLNAAVDYAVLDASKDDYLEQDYLASVCGGRPMALVGNVSQSFLLLAGTWLYLIVMAQTAVLTIPVPGYTSFLECNMHDKAAFASKPHCSGAVRMYIAVFTLGLLAALARNWRVVDLFQRLVTVVTYCALAIMVISCAVGMGKEPFDPQVSAFRVQNVKAFDMGHFSDLFGVVAFCLVCHPGSALMLRNMPVRKHVTKVYAVSFGTVLVLYCAVSVVVAFYMGSCVSGVMNLNWIDFGKTWGAKDSTPLRVLGIVVVMFPLFSVSACCALYCRALAESVEAYLPAAWLYRLAGALGREYRGAGLDLFPVGNVLRVCVVLIPATCALITFKFDKAMAVAGFFAFFIVFFVPGAMQLYSRRVVRRLGLRPSPHETVLGHDSIVLFVMSVCSLAAAFYVWKQLVPALS